MSPMKPQPLSDKEVCFNPPTRLNLAPSPSATTPNEETRLQDKLALACHIEGFPPPPRSPSYDRFSTSFSTTSSFDLLEVCSQVSQVSIVYSSSNYEVVEFDEDPLRSPPYSEQSSACASPRVMTPSHESGHAAATNLARLLQRARTSHFLMGRHYVPGCAVAKLHRNAVFMHPVHPSARRSRMLKQALNPTLQGTLESNLWSASQETSELVASQEIPQHVVLQETPEHVSSAARTTEQ
jgi:hypothetical protein